MENLEQTADPQNPTAAPVPATEPAPIEEASSVSDHAAKFGPDAVETDEPPADKAPHHSATQKRDEGKFTEGRHRSRRQQASPGDVPRIQELTAKFRQAETERDALKARLEAFEKAQPVAGATLPVPAAAHPRLQQAEPPQAPASQASGDPEPDPADAAKYPDGHYDRKFIVDSARWAAREEHRQERARAAEAETEKTIRARFQATKAKYADFDTVTRSALVDLPSQIVHEWILGDEFGPDVLYHLQTHPAERDALLQMTAFGQSRALALLSQRFASPVAEQAGMTGAAASELAPKPAFKPLTPVRTEAARAPVADPSADGSSSIADHAKQFAFKRR